MMWFITLISITKDVLYLNETVFSCISKLVFANKISIILYRFKNRKSNFQKWLFIIQIKGCSFNGFQLLLWQSTKKRIQFFACLSLHLFFLHGKWSSKPSVLSLMHCIVLSIRLFPNGEWIWCFVLRNLHACGCQVPPSVYAGCSP